MGTMGCCQFAGTGDPTDDPAVGACNVASPLVSWPVLASPGVEEPAMTSLVVALISAAACKITAVAWSIRPVSCVLSGSVSRGVSVDKSFSNSIPANRMAILHS